MGILFSYGFMLFDPSSSFQSVRENIGFLRRIVGDGSAAATFCRMLPYGELRSAISSKKRDACVGILRIPTTISSTSVSIEYHRLLSQTVRPWIHNEGLSYQMNYRVG